MRDNIVKKNVYLFEINDILANQVKLPYSVGLIWSYCSTIEKINNNYNLADIFWWRRTTQEILNDISEPSVVGFSCFVWNWNNNVEIAKKNQRKMAKMLNRVWRLASPNVRSHTGLF